MKQITLFLLFLLSAVAVELHAQATLSYQGVVKNTNETSVDNGKYEFVFQLYEDATGGVPVWSETQTDVVVSGGIYSVVLGSVTPLDVPFDTGYYLGVSFDGGAELTPRTQLTAAPYALSLLGNSNVFPNDGNVGIGITDPLEALHVVGNVKIEGNLETTGSSGSIDVGNLTEDVHTSENISAEGNIIAAGDIQVSTDSLSVVAAESPLRIVHGFFDSAGNIVAGSGFSLNKQTNNLYVVTIDPPFSGAFTVTATPNCDNKVYGVITRDPSNPTNPIFAIRFSTDATWPNYTTCAGSFIAVGPR